MKRILARPLFLLFFILIQVVATTAANVYSVEDVPNVRLRDKRMHVSDPERILSDETVIRLNRMLTLLEDSTSIEVAVVVVPAVPDGDCFSFAFNLGRTWGVGKQETDNGLVVLLSTGDRCVQFSTGYGLEGILPDALCKRIQTKYMNPYFSKGEWDRGMLTGMAAVCSVLDGSMSAGSAGGKGDDSFIAVLLFFIIGFALFGSGVSFYAMRKERRCPNCRKYKLHRVNTVCLSDKNGVKEELVTYRCAECGHTVSRKVKKHIRRDNDDFGSGSGGGPIFWGGGFGGGSGGFGGGSFGGGSFGGGGSGSKF